MRRIAIRAMTCLTIVGLGFANVQIAVGNWADASGVHNWESWHWDRSTLYVNLTGTHRTEAVKAVNVWNGRTNLTLRSTTNHSDTDISLWGATYGNTGWAGLATVETAGWDWHCWAYCGLRHVHARYNNSVRPTNSWYVQKVFCHELGHAFGYDHNSTGGCMISGYWPNLSNEPSSHDIGDVNARY